MLITLGIVEEGETWREMERGRGDGERRSGREGEKGEMERKEMNRKRRKRENT